MIGSLPIKLSHEVYLLGSYELNIYLVKGKRCALIEGGSSAQFPLLLEQLNYLEISPHDIEYLIVLHSHADHIMAFPPLQEMFPWMRIAAFSGSRKVFDDARIVGKLKESDRGIANSLAEAGLGNSEVYHSPSPHYPMDIPLKEGDLIELGDGVNLKVIETPGHAPDSISLYLERDGVLFVSDAIGIFYPPDDIKPSYFYHLGMYETSLGRVRDVGVTVLCKGHQGMVIGERKIEDYIQLAFIGVEKFKREVLEALGEGRDVDEVCREITDAYQKGILGLFPWESNFNLFRLMVRRTLEYLDTPTNFKA
jgi:glyoxylase-like metal-dependent hydrolase (beta-lactamase superfamily II)